MAATIDQITLADDPDRWESLGFEVCNETVALGTVRIALAGRNAGRGVLSWSLRGVASTELDGLATTVSEQLPHTVAGEHPNGIVAIDHLVAMSSELERSIQALQSAGLELRRIREQPTPLGAPRQAFFRLGEVILEVVQEPAQLIEDSNKPTRFWGFALLAYDLDRIVEQLGHHASEIRAAVQSGRRIATLRRSAGLAVPIALMSRAGA